MKKYIIIKTIAIVLLTTFLASCSKELDSLRPKDKIEQEQLTENDISLLRNGVYNNMEDVIYRFWWDFDVRGENFKAGPGFGLVDPMNMSPSSTDVTSMWQTAFTKLNQVNFLIETIDHLGENASASAKSIKGEMYYFRALIYYNLVIRWGRVPIITQRTYDAIQRSNESEVWTQIISDLKTAQKLTGAFSSCYYISQPAIQALIAKVYLINNLKDSTITYCQKIISSAKFAQVTDATSYASMFIAGSTSKEIIFALANNTTTNKHLFYGNVNDVDATWDYSPETTLFSSLYSDKTMGKVTFVGDKRKTAVFSADASRLIKFPNGKTGQQLVSTSNADFTPIIVSRYSDILLLLAEAQGAGNSAATTLVPYFSNRYTTPPSTVAIASLNSTDFQDMILNERRREFYGEGQWWFDVKRTNRVDLFKSLAGRNYLLVYPIPQTEKDLAGYTQNPGY